MDATTTPNDPGSVISPRAELPLAEWVARCRAARWRKDPFVCYEIAKEALVHYPGDPQLRSAQAFALIQTGSLNRAQTIVEELLAEGRTDPETYGLLGRIWKDRANAAHEVAERSHCYLESFRAYSAGYESGVASGNPDAYYPAINAAAMAVWLNRADDAQDFARKAAVLAEAAVAKAHDASGRDLWAEATLAEARLIQGDLQGARELYCGLQSASPAEDQIATTRRQARRLAAHLHGDRALLDDCFRMAPVLLFVGHMTDAPGRATPRFPETLAPGFRKRLVDRLRQLSPQVGYASAARGGDLIFLEEMQALGAQTHVVLALASPMFQESSVTSAANPEWDDIYQRVLAGASSVRVANEHSSKGDATAFEHTTRLLIGLAQLRARQLETDLRAIALWDGAPGDGSGGTAWAIKHLQEIGVPVENLWESRTPAVEVAAMSSTLSSPAPGAGAAPERTICAMLFADVKGYSKLREEEIFGFSQKFLAGVARLIEESDAPPIARNTWGDGLFFVFADVRGAGRFAMELSDAVRLRAAKLGLPAGMALRIGLHAGPIYPMYDPVTARQTFVGVNVALTARIEPIVVENQVFASEAFAALCAAEGLIDFHFEYLGSTELAKRFGSVPLFQLHPAGEKEAGA